MGGGACDWRKRRERKVREWEWEEVRELATLVAVAVVVRSFVDMVGRY